MAASTIFFTIDSIFWPSRISFSEASKICGEAKTLSDEPGDLVSGVESIFVRLSSFDSDPLLLFDDLSFLRLLLAMTIVGFGGFGVAALSR